MKKLVCWLTAVLGMSCLVAVPGSASATLPPLPITITCTSNGCTGSGVSGLLYAYTVRTPSFDAAVICLNSTTPCGLASADLIFAPGTIIGGAGVGSAGVGFIVQQVGVLVIGAVPHVTAVIEATKYGSVLSVVTPLVHKCVYLIGLALTIPAC
jgi:hypothetical protein